MIFFRFFQKRGLTFSAQSVKLYTKHNRLSGTIYMITMQNIADKAGVSKGTVSYVLNGKHKKARINQETCAKVIAIAESLGYRRNAIAQSMKTGKTNVIGFIGGLYSSYCMEIIKGINDVASKNNYMIKLLPAESIEEVKNAARQCVEQRLAGVICRSLSEEGLEILHKELEPHNIPIVLVDSSFSHDWCSRVISDDFEGAKMATEYLLKSGHRKIGFVTNIFSRGFAKMRYDGYSEATAKNGIDLQKDDICILDYKDEISPKQRNIVKDFLQKQKISAVFCASDPLAMKIINVAQSLNIKIPDDLSVIGFAGVKYTAFSSPALTTVKQPFIEMGRESCKILLSEIKIKNKAKEVKLPVRLVIRDSVRDINKQ